MSSPDRITSPDHPGLNELCAQLVEMSGTLTDWDAWCGGQLDLCGRHGVFEWFASEAFGGQDWSDPDLIRGYLRLSAACLTTAFVITQRSGACRRIYESDNEPLKARLLPDLTKGNSFATLGISHLTTSRRHLQRPVLRAEESDDGFVLDGFSPWVTGASAAQHIVTGAELEDGRQIVTVLPTDLPGVSSPAAAQLVGLTASQTGEVRCDRVNVAREWLLAGPVENVMRQGVGGKTGGLQTSTLAIGLAGAAIELIETEAERRPDLEETAQVLREQQISLRNDLLAMAEGNQVCTNELLRTRANSLVLRATQAALAAAKGTGYVASHPAGRWCREALFFLVWSCPQPVMAANLCEFAGINQ